MTTVDVSRCEARPPVRVTRVRRVDPPFDDELSHEIWGPPDQLTFDWSTPAQPSPRPTPDAGWAPSGTASVGTASASTASATRPADGTHAGAADPGAVGALPAGRPGHGAATVPGVARDARVTSDAPVARDARVTSDARVARPGSGAAAGGRGHSGAAGDARLAVRRFVAVFVEVLNGFRPPAHLRHLSVPLNASAVVAQGMVGAQRVAQLRKPVRPGNRRDRGPGPVAVVRMRLCEPRPGAVEASVVLVTADRTWALALRLELREDRWSATTLRLI